MKIPGPDHPITIDKNDLRVKVIFNGHTIADTVQALELREATLPPVQYIPRQDVDMSALSRTSHATHCPYKGDAGYFSLSVGDKTTENAVWTYEDPYSAVAQIKEYLAFYPARVDSIEIITA